MENLSEYSDEELVRKARVDPDYFGELFRRYDRKLLYFLHPRLVRDKAEAEDIVQLGMCKAYRALESFDCSKSWNAWMHKIVLNLAFMSKRCRKPLCLDDYIKVPGPDNLEDDLDNGLLREKINRAVALLNQKEKMIIRSIYFSGKSEKETAAVLGWPISLVRSVRIHALRCIAIAAS